MKPDAKKCNIFGLFGENINQVSINRLLDVGDLWDTSPKSNWFALNIPFVCMTPYKLEPVITGIKKEGLN